MHIVKATRVPLYLGMLVVVISDEKDKCIELTNERMFLDYKEIFATAAYGTYKGSQGFFVFLNPNNTRSKVTRGVVAHEAVHAANFILEDRGVIADFVNDEPQAYLMGWIVDQIYKTFDKVKHD